MNQTYYWYVLKTHVSNEDSIAKTLREHVESFNLHDEIIDIKVLKNYKILESEEFHPNSDKLPEKSFRSTKKSQWLHLRNGNYMRVRIQEEKPYRGMIFIRMTHNLRLFHDIRTWVPGTIFLGAINSPEIISDEQFDKMAAPFIKQQAPDLQQYLLAKHWQDLMINSKRDPKSFSTKTNANPMDALSHQFEIVTEHDVNQLFQLDQEALDHDFGVGTTSVILNTQKPIELPKATLLVESETLTTPLTTASPQTVAVLKTAVEPEPIVQPTVEIMTVPSQFVVNQKVYLPKLETEGIIQEIKPKRAEVIVQIEMFGRSQSITVGPEEIQLLPE